MNKLLLTLFWLISLLVMFFIGKNTGAGNYAMATKTQLSSPQSVEANTTNSLLVENKKCDTEITKKSNSSSSSNQTIQGSSNQNISAQSQHALIEELADVKQQLAQAEYKLASFYAANPESSHSAKLAKVTEDEVAQHLSAPFDSVVLNARGSMVDKFKQLHQEPLDQEWAIVTEQHISDYFVTHDLADKVKLDGVTCKQTICEIRGFELENEAWGRVMSDMRVQPWWNFASSHSTTQNNKEFGKYFYALLSKTVM